jgi:AcrR family transcriptional regulator
MTKREKPRDRRLDKDDWLELALTTLARESVDKVLIVPLAKKLGVTKGSFYWHFKSREEFLTEVLALWRQRATRRIIEIVDAHSDDPAERLAYLFKIAVETKYEGPGGSLELAIRDWARLDPQARRIVATVDDERLDYLAAQYRALGFADDDARTRALMQYSFSTGNGIVFGMSDKKERRAKVDACWDILTARPARAGQRRKAG